MSVTGPPSHRVLFYRGAAEYLAEVVPFVEHGLELGEPVLVAVPRPNLEALRAELGGSAARVLLVDMAEAGRNPGRIIPRVLRPFADAHPDVRVRVVAEPAWPGRGELEYPACLQHEALLNLAFDRHEITMLCPYDAGGLDRPMLDGAVIAHPLLADGDGERANPGYDLDRALLACNPPLPEPAGAATELAFDSANLGAARALTVERALLAGIPRDRVVDVELVVGEMAANTLVHGGGSGTLRLWTEGAHLVCEVRDAGHITDPLVGRRPVGPEEYGGRGVLLVNQVSDLVRLHTGPGGTTVRAYFSLVRQAVGGERLIE